MNRRVSTRVLEDAGDVIRDVNLVDVSASETLAAAEHDPTGTVAWRPALASTNYYQFLVKTRDKTAGGHVTTHQLETILGKLNRAYPRSVTASGRMIRTALSLPPGSTVTMRQALQFTLQRWAAEFTWLTWATLPELTVQTSSGTITPVVEALALRQPPNGKRSARQWLDEFLGLFAGYVLRVNTTGQLVIVPPPTGAPTLTLPASKIITLDRSVSFDNIINRATVQSNVWAHEPTEFSHPVTISAASTNPDAQAWVGNGTAPPGRDRSGFTALPNFTEGDTPVVIPVPLHEDVIPSLGTVFLDVHVDGYHRTWDAVEGAHVTAQWFNQNVGFFQEGVLTEDAQEGDTVLRVAPLEQPLLNGTEIFFPHRGSSIPVTVRAYVSGNHARGATTINLASPAPGLPALTGDVARGTAFLHSRIQFSTGWDVVSQASTGPNTLAYRLSMDTSPEGVLTLEWMPPLNLSHRDPLNPQDEFEFGIRVAIRAYTYNWTRTSNQVSATFGDATNPGQVSDLPGFVDSQGDFGIIERTLPAGFVNLSVDDSMAIAQAYVRANMHPRERVTLEVTPDLPIKPSDINKLVHVAPLGAEAVIESWEHTEMFDNTSASVTTRVTGVLTGDAEPVNPGLMSFSRAFNREFSGGLHSPQRPWWEE